MAELSVAVRAFARTPRAQDQYRKRLSRCKCAQRWTPNSPRDIYLLLIDDRHQASRARRSNYLRRVPLGLSERARVISQVSTHSSLQISAPDTSRHPLRRTSATVSASSPAMYTCDAPAACTGAPGAL